MSRVQKSRHHFEHYSIDMLNATDDELREIAETLGLGLSMSELRHIRDHYLIKERRATDVELQTYDQTWSEHCFHKTFKGLIETRDGQVDGMLKSCLGRVVRELNPSWCYSVFEDNAGIVDLDDEYAIAIKVETHNHPSAIEPFGGAATGLGGVIRDVLGVWADPIACTDVLCFGPLDMPYDRLPEGVKHPSYIFNGVVDGIGSYGNSIGIPTVNGAVCFDEDYTGNVVVYAGCIGLLRKDRYIRNAKVGDKIVLAGGRTGLDGIHGVTFASAELTEESEEVSRPAVQIANPIEEEKVKRAIKQISEEKLGSGITDLGGGGLSCAVCEMADRFGVGVEVDLANVPLKYPKMAPWEIWVSESQERMCLAVPVDNVERVLEIFNDEQTEANVIGTFTAGDEVNVRFHSEHVAKLEISSLFDPPRIHRKTMWEPQAPDEPQIPTSTDLGETLRQLLATPNIASKEKVVRRYDHEVKGGTVIKPLQGWNAGPSDGAVLKPLTGSWKGVTVSCGVNPRFGKLDPYWMAASALDEAIRNNVAMGGRRIALLDNFTWGNPEYEDRLGGLVMASKACYDVASVYGTPFISGKDSLYNESPLGPVAPTLLITALGLIPDIRKAVTMDLKRPDDSIYLLGTTKPELGGSMYYRLNGFLGSSVPRLEPEKTVESYQRLTSSIDSGFVRACHDLSEGGLGVALSEMAFTAGLGVEVDLDKVTGSSTIRDDMALFSESNGRLLVEVRADRSSEFEEKMAGTAYCRIGSVTSSDLLTIRGKKGILIEEPLVRLMSAWKTPLGGV